MFQVREFPYLVYIRDNKVYLYQGSLELKDLTDFLSADNYLEADIFVDDFERLAASLTGEDSIVSFFSKYSIKINKYIED